MSLSHIGIRDAETLLDANSLQEVFHVPDPHALIQAAGYVKFKNSHSQESVYFRGQAELYKTLSPSLFREFDSQKSQSKRVTRINEVVKEISSKNKTFSRVHELCKQPLLQHYGLKTTWLDLVDNIWIALWFACHIPRFTGAFGQFLHFERRTPSKEPNGFAYIVLVAVDADRIIAPGIFVGQQTEFVDLRSASPSIFLRPHAQHGVLFRLRGQGVMRPSDYASQIRGIIRIQLADALAWLGTGEMLGVHALFPPPYYDQGYEFLLNSKFEGDYLVGAISHIGA